MSSVRCIGAFDYTQKSPDTFDFFVPSPLVTVKCS